MLLDLDGTLIDSAPGITASVRHAYRSLALPEPTATVLRSFVGPPLPHSLAAHGVPLHRIDDGVAAYRQAFAAGAMFDAEVYDGIPDLLRALAAANTRVAIATAKPEVYARELVEHFGLAGMVEQTFGASMDASRRTKAAVIARALRDLSTSAPVPAPDEVVMVGDREHDVLGAREHGIATIGAAWGYAGPGELQEAGAVVVADSPAAVGALLLA